MKVGLSYSRCVKDIVLGVVPMRDVLVIVSRTDFDPQDPVHWKNIWEGYVYGGFSDPVWAMFEDQEEDFKRVTLELHDQGKLHQPRHFGVRTSATRHHWLETVLPAEIHDKYPAVKAAGENYKLLACLSEPESKTKFNDNF